MDKTVTFVTSQYKCDRIIRAGREIADNTQTELLVVGVLDSEYELDPEAIDYLFRLSKSNKATMRLLFSEEKLETMLDVISVHDSKRVVTGMPSNNESVLYSIWKQFPQKTFYTVDTAGECVEVAKTEYCTA